MTRLRIAAVLGDRMPAWAWHSVELLAASGACDLVALKSSQKPREGGLGLRGFRKLDRRLFFAGPHALDLQSAPPASRAATLPLGEPSGVDVVFDPAGLLPGAPQPATRRVWSYQGCGPALGFREVATLAPHVRVALVERSGGHESVLAETTGERDLRSMARTQEALLWRAAELPARVAQRLTAGAAVPGPIAAQDFGDPSPSVLDVAMACARLAVRPLSDRIRDRLRPAKWCLGWQPRAGSPDVAAMRWLPGPRGWCWADPFPHEHGPHRGIFFEQFPVPFGHGSIHYLPWDAARNDWGAAAAVLREPFHLSYPFVFEHEGRIYMVPETAEAGQVRLYRCESYPLEWKFDRVLLDGITALDNTLLEHDGRWWLFAAVAVPNGRPDELCLFHAQSPLGPFQPHPLNPVLSDLRCARPAGRIFVENGELIRPAQDCSGGYGRALVFRRILELTPRQYREETVRRIDPGWRKEVQAIHTWNQSASFTCADAALSVKRGSY